MQRTTLSNHFWPASSALSEAWSRRTLSQQPFANPAVAPNTLSLAAGFAFQARDGLAYTLRRVRPADAEALAAFMRRLSDRTRLMRYMTARPNSSEFVSAEVGRLVAGATGNSITLIVADARGASEAVVAVAELAYDRANRTGELAVVVADDAQCKGIGSMLLRQVLQLAREYGLTYLHADMLAENHAIQRLILSIGVSYSATIQAGEMHIVARVPIGRHSDGSFQLATGY